MKSVALFNNKGGVGKTSLVYHLAWMFSELGVSTLAVDLDPQANLTSMFLDEDRLLEIWDSADGKTIFESLRPMMERTGDIEQPHVVNIEKKLNLLPGNLSLSRFEDLLSENWPKCLAGDPGAFRVITAFYRMILKACEASSAELVLIDVGPNLGAINRSALIAAENVLVPLAPDLFSMQGLKNLGPSLRDWRIGWKKRIGEKPTDLDLPMPSGAMNPLGYVVMQHSTRDSRPVKAYVKWLNRMPAVFRESVLGVDNQDVPSVDHDPYRLALLKHYRSLAPMAQEARKPMFYLKPADGAIGAHIYAVQACHEDFKCLAIEVAKNIGLEFQT